MMGSIQIAIQRGVFRRSVLGGRVAVPCCIAPSHGSTAILTRHLADAQSLLRSGFWLEASRIPPSVKCVEKRRRRLNFVGRPRKSGGKLWLKTIQFLGPRTMRRGRALAGERAASP